MKNNVSCVFFFFRVVFMFVSYKFQGVNTIYMTNKDNGFRVRVHNENRMNTYILKQAAAIRYDDFDE